MEKNMKNLTIDKKTVSKYGKEIIKKEIDDISRLLNFVDDDSFYEACLKIYNNDGYLILTGIGKSGLIARKISSTFSSTGTPSFFLHPAEASHGDLGMIRENSLVMAISNSGESKELYNILNYCNNNNIPVIGITSNKKSTLAKKSNILLLLPFVSEACFMNIVPTSSTSMTLVLGDSIAATVYRMRNFSREDFKKLHPGGDLGKKLAFAKDIMNSPDEVAILSSDDSLFKLIDEMNKNKRGACLIVNNDKLCGIITDGDLRRLMLKLLDTNIDKNQLKIKDILNDNMIYFYEDTSLLSILKIVNDYRINCIPIVDDHKNMKLKGVIFIHELLKYLN